MPMASHKEDEPSRQQLEKNHHHTAQEGQKSGRCEGEAAGPTVSVSTDGSEDSGQDAPQLLRCHDSQVNGNNPNDTSPKTEDVPPDSGNTIGRVIMIDGIKFVAVTCLEPPKGHCRTCSLFGSLLYFSARSCYILEAAEKFCSVRCARMFIKEKDSCHTPSRQPSGDIGSSVSVPRSRVVKDRRGKKNAAKLSDSKDARGRGMKSNQASRDEATLTGIYVDSMVIETKKKVGNSTKRIRRRNPKSGGTDGHLTTPLSEQLDKVKLEVTFTSDTSARDKFPKSSDRMESASSDRKDGNPDSCEDIGAAPKVIEMEKEKPLPKMTSSGPGASSTPSKSDAAKIEQVSVIGKTKRNSFPPISSSVWRHNDLSNVFMTGPMRGQKKKSKSIASSRRPCIVDRFSLQQCHVDLGGKDQKAKHSVSNKPLRNEKTRGSLTSKTKMWKKHGAKFQTRSCEFPQEEMTKECLSRDCHTPDPTSKGLVMSISSRNMQRERDDTIQSLNQFHERRRSLFKTMFPFQETLGTRVADDPSNFSSPGEETPSEPSGVEDCGDVSTLAPLRKSPGTTCAFKEEDDSNARLDLPGCKTAQNVFGKDKENGGRQGSKWANLFKLMIEASDREDAQKNTESSDCDQHKEDKICVKDQSEIADVAIPESGIFGRSAEAEVRLIEKKVDETKKKKKKRKRKKKKRSQQNVALEFLTTPTVDDKKHDAKKHPEHTPTRNNRKGKDKNKQSGQEPESPDSPVDPNDWPKWRGDGKKRMDMMTSIDHLIWTLKNKFQPIIGRSPRSKVNGNLNESP